LLHSLTRKPNHPVQPSHCSHSLSEEEAKTAMREEEILEGTNPLSVNELPAMDEIPSRVINKNRCIIT